MEKAWLPECFLKDKLGENHEDKFRLNSKNHKSHLRLIFSFKNRRIFIKTAGFSVPSSVSHPGTWVFSLPVH